MTQMKTSSELSAKDYVGTEEQREASLPEDGSVAVVDDKSAVVTLTEDLTPVPDVSSAMVDDIVHVLAKTSDWLQLYEAVLKLRRIVVHHSEVFTTKQVEECLRPLACECDSLRSTPSKNGLLALTECFQFLPRSVLERPLLGGAHPEVLDVLLRRSVCEKKFLRDAASVAAEKLANHLAGLPLLTAAAKYGTNKNAKMCGSAAKIIALSLLRMQQGPSTLSTKGGESLKVVYRALAAFRESKDGTARSEATVSFQYLGDLLGAEGLKLGLKEALPGAGQAGVVARILKDAFPTNEGAKTLRRTGSLRDRINGRTAAVATK